MIVIKKLLSEARLDGCEELIEYFSHIDEINDKYFTINVHTMAKN